MTEVINASVEKLDSRQDRDSDRTSPNDNNDIEPSTGATDDAGVPDATSPPPPPPPPTGRGIRDRDFQDRRDDRDFDRPPRREHDGRDCSPPPPLPPRERGYQKRGRLSPSPPPPPYRDRRGGPHSPPPRRSPPFPPYKRRGDNEFDGRKGSPLPRGGYGGPRFGNDNPGRSEREVGGRPGHLDERPRGRLMGRLSAPYHGGPDNLIKVHDAFSQFSYDVHGEDTIEEPNAKAKTFYEMYEKSNKPLWPGHDVTMLEWAAEIMSNKVGFRVSQAAVDGFVKNARNTAPKEYRDKIPSNFRTIKNLMMNLGLSVIKYDICPNHCFLYYKEGAQLDKCAVCGVSRYFPRTNSNSKLVAQRKLWYFPVTERLQRLYMSRNTAEHMTWHMKCERRSERVIHPAGSEAWAHLDDTFPEFAVEPRNVRLGLSSDDFDPNHDTTGDSHSIWPVFVTPYNLPPDLAMRPEFIFLTLLISGPRSPGKHIDVMFRPLIDELKDLWNNGAITYDNFKKQNFTMKAAVMWTISDFPVYGMLSGWSTHGRLGCPCCMQNNIDSFQLLNGRKTTWFDCHRKFLPASHRERWNNVEYVKGRMVEDVCPERMSNKHILSQINLLPDVTFGAGYKKIPGFGKRHNWMKKSIFWELPYWSCLLVRHNLDVMHVEKNVFENVKSTIFDNDNSSMDNLNARKDLKLLTNRSSLFLNGETRQKPKATYNLTNEQRKAVCEWLKSLRFPDGHASNIGSKVKLDKCKISGMKCHDCHVFMQRLLPIAFRDFLPEPIWETLTELSNFFRAICALEISPSEMCRLGSKIVETLCKLEKIFPPSFFDCMEHLVVHLPYEARVAGPVFYRSMYPFERMMWLLKNNNMNKNHIEGSIAQAYLIKEVSNFCSFYFGRDVNAPATQARRNQRPQETPAFEGQLSICIPKGEPITKATEKVMTSVDFNAAILYIVRNCSEFDQYVQMFDAQFGGMLTTQELEDKRVNSLISWLRQMNRVGNLYLDPKLSILLYGGNERVVTYGGYVCNGLLFHTLDYDRHRNTMCSGVSLIDSGDTYYGMLREIVEITFYGLDFSPQKICLFKCDWYDNVRGVKVHPMLSLVDIDSTKRLTTAEPFILAEQATQVYYAPYPSSLVCRPTRKGIWAVCPTRARHIIDTSAVTEMEEESEYYQDPLPPRVPQLKDELSHFNVQNDLADTNVGLIDIIDDIEDENDE